MSTPLVLRLQRIHTEAPHIRSFEFVRADGATLPAFAAGAHIDLVLPGGLVRSYSLLDPEAVPVRYRIAVALAEGGRGGSAHLHQSARVGEDFEVHPPRNHFALDSGDGQAVLIAGGIGVTPLLAMAQSLNARQRPWRLFYAARSRSRAAFLTELQTLAAAGQGEVHGHFDDEHGGAPLDVSACLAAAPPEAHFYCCGPAALMQAFEAATAGQTAGRVHMESFAPVATGGEGLGGFHLELAQSGQTLWVPPGRTMLSVLLEAGVDAPHVCMEGTCGSCEVAVLAGRPLHRDHVLSAQEREANEIVMVCCSGCQSERLTLDL